MKPEWCPQWAWDEARRCIVAGAFDHVEPVARALIDVHQRGRREGMEWQPIETAPKDGGVIIGYWNEEYMETIAFRDGEWIWSHDGDTWLKSGPTHWMPLPDAPSAIRAKAQEVKP